LKVFEIARRQVVSDAEAFTVSCSSRPMMNDGILSVNESHKFSYQQLHKVFHAHYLKRSGLRFADLTAGGADEDDSMAGFGSLGHESSCCYCFVVR
jgi:hypothetical protein